MIRRKVLIISNPGEENSEDYSKGVFVDVENYKKFLLSPLGGYWDASEIIYLNRPRKTFVDAYIKSIESADYTFIVYTGHGYYSEASGSTILNLRPGEKYDSLDLRSGQKAMRRTIILDCCRKVTRHYLTEDEFLAKVARRRVTLNADECRRYFDEDIMKCGSGIVIGNSCSENEYSHDHPISGGYYSSSLLKTTNNWYENTNVNLSESYSCFSIVAAHNGALEFVKKLSGGTQNPEIAKPRSEPYFPFAIMA